MTRVRFIIAPVDDHWVVRGEGDYRQAYDDHSQAIRMAVAAAHAAGENGAEADVVGVDGSGELYPIWTYGLDSFVTEKPEH